MKTFDFTIQVDFFHGKTSKVAKLENFTYPEAFNVFTDLKLKYANDNFPFKSIQMFVFFPDTSFYSVHRLSSDFIDFSDEPLNF